jgi:hypothetical protein
VFRIGTRNQLFRIWHKFSYHKPRNLDNFWPKILAAIRSVDYLFSIFIFSPLTTSGAMTPSESKLAYQEYSHHVSRARKPNCIPIKPNPAQANSLLRRSARINNWIFFCRANVYDYVNQTGRPAESIIYDRRYWALTTNLFQRLQFCTNLLQLLAQVVHLRLISVWHMQCHMQLRNQCSNMLQLTQLILNLRR